MSGSVTPARRPRDDSDDSDDEVGEDFEVSVDGESPPPSNRSKRARYDEGEDDEELVQEDGLSDGDEGREAPLLPDSFRRSPKGKGRAVNGCQSRQAPTGKPKTHQPGSIVRVTLTDFVTYTNAEFNPGPNLNMIIGPNGTGKSTLVCAICIGLGWATKHLGRGKDLDEYVKHGAAKGKVEIELAADPRRQATNPVITTTIKKGDKANAEYSINGKKANKKRVQELCNSFSIQVDNLCQFLPQDRVVEFAGLSPVDLLTETQRAAAPQQMSDWHAQLKEWRKQEKVQLVEQQSLLETIKRMEERQRLQAPDVERLRERVELQEKLHAYEKLRPYPEYREAKENHSEAKRQRKEAEKEFAQLDRRLQPNLAAVAQKEQYLGKIVNGPLPAQKKMVDNCENRQVGQARKRIDAVVGKIKDCDNKRAAEAAHVKKVKQSMPGLQREVNDIQKAINSPRPEFDAAAFAAQIRDKTREIRDAETQLQAVNGEVGSIGLQMTQRKQAIEQEQAKKDHLRSQAGQQMNKLYSFSKDGARAWQWIKDNRGRFQSEVFGPPLLECRVKDQRHAPIVESMIQQGDALAFTVTSKADFDMLTDQIKSMNLRQVSVRSALQGLDHFRAPVSNDALPQYGLQGWLIDLLEGPDPVLAMLCDNRNIHQTGYTFGDLSQIQFNALSQSAISSWATPKQSYMVSRRREYGDKATSTKVQDIGPARFFTQTPVDHQQEGEIDRKVAEIESELEELRESRLERMKRERGLAPQVDMLNKEKDAIVKDKKDRQAQQTKYDGLSAKLDGAQEKLNNAKEQLAGSAQRMAAIHQEHDTFAMEKGQGAIDYANAVESLRQQRLKLYEIEILAIEARSDLDQIRAQQEEEVRLLDAKRKEVGKFKDQEAKLLQVGMRLQERCNALHEDLSETALELLQEVKTWNMDRLSTEIVSLTARLDSLVGGGNENTLREYEARAGDIERKTQRFNELRTALDTLGATITGIREQWEPELEALVSEISEAFAENFAKIQCAGEVGVYKDEDFEQWAIQIKVKFRENEPLSLLDKHRQSGGERAVSTIFYLMALQSLARAPFRVVDEINQGMDPRNERLVHSRMVDIACSEVREGRQGSQYFLITPKLLQGLRYHPDMKVHCIASGEHMPADFREVDFATAAKRALELRGRQAGVAAG